MAKRVLFFNKYYIGVKLYHMHAWDVVVLSILRKGGGLEIFMTKVV